MRQPQYENYSSNSLDNNEQAVRLSVIHLTLVRKYILLVLFHHRFINCFFTTENKMYPRFLKVTNTIIQTLLSLFLIALFASQVSLIFEDLLYVQWTMSITAYSFIAFILQSVFHIVCSWLIVRGYRSFNNERQILSAVLYALFFVTSHAIVILVVTGDQEASK